MQIKLDFRSKIPIYVQIVDQIKHLIATGILRPDEQMPPIRELAAKLDVNFTTIARAYRCLDEEGLISTQHGRGTYILPQPADQKNNNFRRADLARLTHYFLVEAARLGCEPDEIADIVNDNLRLWETDGSPPIKQSE